MMQYEFEKLAGRRVTERQYSAFENLYNDSDMDKVDFVESVRELLKHIPEIRERRPKHTVAIMNPNGNIMSIDGKYVVATAEIMDVDIGTGVTTLRMIPFSERLLDIGELDPTEGAKGLFFSDNPKIRWIKGE